MNSAFKKTLALLAAFVVLGLIALVTGGLEELYRPMFPDLSDRALANIEATSNIVGLVLAIWLSIKTYKRLAKTEGNRRDRIDSSFEHGTLEFVPVRGK